jgi:hypothetical protein
LISQIPKEPSESPPERTTPIARSVYATASEEKSASTASGAFSRLRAPFQLDPTIVHREDRIRRYDVHMVGV